MKIIRQVFFLLKTTNPTFFSFFFVLASPSTDASRANGHHWSFKRPYCTHQLYQQLVLLFRIGRPAAPPPPLLTHSLSTHSCLPHRARRRTPLYLLWQLFTDVLACVDPDRNTVGGQDVTAILESICNVWSSVCTIK